MGNKQRKEEVRRALGMPAQTARNKLTKNLLLESLKLQGLNACFRCGKPITHPDNFSIEHLQPWLEGPDNAAGFWNPNNVIFSHTQCESEDASMIEVQLLDELGRQLQTFRKDGKTYVAGKKGQKFKIKVRNTTGKNIELVGSVDGRDVVSGQVADYKEQSGYIIKPYGSYIIEGFRKDMSTVAAFEFDAPGESYSSKMGTPENVGVLGFAAFEEAWKPATKIAYVPEIRIEPQPWRPYWPCTPRVEPVWVYNPNHTLIGGVHTVGNTRGLMGGGTKISCSSAGPMQASLHAQPQSYGGFTPADNAPSTPEIGVKYGEDKSSKVYDTPFERRSPHRPDELLAIYYDSLEALQERGIAPKEMPKQHTPDPFPNSGGRFAPPPPR